MEEPAYTPPPRDYVPAFTSGAQQVFGDVQSNRGSFGTWGGSGDIGFGDVPLICARELDIVGATPRCIRVLMHLTTERGRSEMRHVYLEGAAALRDDLPE